ncbi:putative tetratricopeptide-like helical domain superfamily [Helianthus annuus]|nr:putative tetratricopeptide-like helical domain superfamily [Helianthus annuus]
MDYSKNRYGSKQLLGLVHKSGFDSDMYIQNALIHFYSGCDHMGYAYKVFHKMPEKDVVSWTSVINGLVDNKRPMDGLRLFKRMEMEGFGPNDVTMISVLRACAETGALSVGIKLDQFVNGRGVKLKKKCHEGFYEAVNKDVYVWTTMIAGLASHGRCKEAVELFEQMESIGLKPDEKTKTNKKLQR